MCVPTSHIHGNPNRGAALLLALSVLALFMFLGTVYIRFVTLEVEINEVMERQHRARMAAETGFRIAVGEILQARSKGESVRLDQPRIYALPVYTGMQSTREGVEATLEPRRRATVTVTIEDENARLNLNHTPPRVLQRVLGIDHALAQAIYQGLPGNGDAGAWYLQPDDLVTRGIIPEEVYESLDWTRVSTINVPNPTRPEAHLNLNTAPEDILGAVLDLTDAEASALARRRPFDGAADFLAAVNKPTVAFAYPSDTASDPLALPSAFTLESRCYRIQTEANYSVVDPDNPGNPLQRFTRGVEAVIQLDDADEKGYRVLFWKAHRHDDRIENDPKA